MSPIAKPSILGPSVLVLLLIGQGEQSLANLIECNFTSWFSEEHGYWYDKLDGYPMTGLMCQGDFCDDLRATQCTQYSDGTNVLDLKLMDPHCDEPVLPFSEEGSGMGQCPDGQFVESIKCDGHFCDHLVLKCCRPQGWAVHSSQTQDTPWFTDYGGQDCPSAHVVIGVRCKRWFCDDMQLICSPIVLNFNNTMNRIN